MKETRILNREPTAEGSPLSGSFGREQAALARAYHRSFPQYARTPLVPLPAMAARLGVGGIFVKDESKRFGLNAFKVLGGSYAIGRYIAARAGLAAEKMDYATLTGEALRPLLRDTTFFTATDGNHGRGVAWTARELGCRAVVRMPKGTVKSRVENIRALGAEVTVEERNYDGCVRLAAQQAAQTPGSVVVQDTAWPGYEQIPLHIMQGYLTMALEADEQLDAPPTHILLQAGVGSMAAAVAGYFALRYADAPPRIVVVEPTRADCFFQSARAGRAVASGDLNTMMAGLACAVPNPIAWDILDACASGFLVCEDQVSALGMRLLASPLGQDARVVSGESGAVSAGALWEIMTCAQNAPVRDALGLGAQSRVLMISTEGATDPENYRRITAAQP